MALMTLKHAPSITTPNLVAVGQTRVPTSRGELQNWGPLGLRPLEIKRHGLSQETRPSHLCYLAERGRSALKIVSINRG